MSDYQIRNIELLVPEQKRELLKLFSDMYIEMRESGLMLDLVEDGEEKWLSAVDRTLGRFSNLQLAFCMQKVVGFAYGSLAITTDYLGSKKVGIINHVFVMKEHRKSQLASKMISGLEDWFRQNNVHSIELQVLFLNEGAKEFWERMNYTKELLQMRKFIGEK